MLKSFVWSVLMLMTVFSTGALALPPPGKIETRNLDADLIVYGRIEKVMFDEEEPSFLLYSLHIIKGINTHKPNDFITIYCDPVLNKSPNPKLEIHIQGIKDIQIEKGNHVIVYLEQDNKGRYKPVLKGLSVIVTERLHMEKNQAVNQ